MCPLSFKQFGTLRNHIKAHSSVNPFSGQYCQKSFLINEYLKIHIRIHTGEKPYACRECEYASATSGHLKTHIMRHHSGIQIKDKNCSTSDKSFATTGDLKRHKHRHTGLLPRPHSCQICTKSFFSKKKLKQSFISSQWWKTTYLHTLPKKVYSICSSPISY